MNNLQQFQCVERHILKVSRISLSQTFVKYLRQRISQYLNSSPEPRVWQSKTPQGKVIWHIYHPKTSQTGHFTSEQEARIWIKEQSYY
ncbi:hypothetical protein H6G11_15330 [Cyanobacterium aponinum FACHB-4101]|uniref:Uncharacterized protein n=1 Tax=Cyanobacterium aponinum 0216 TaxID=2676140 RepID=A0A844GXN8_9CHRO|nr:hypothetical protein [Cyanobacterium aponinum]MBD2395618.1 hypothetical protein [Cyanobacterium aponinum FACHB-4101]MTF39791.1 hypothetical protein [Cyanobacterium aponinum 0216]